VLSALHRLHHSRLLLYLAVVACFTHAYLLFSRTAQDDEDLFSDIVAQTPVRREPVRESAADRVELNRAQAMVVTLQAQVCDPVRRSNATSLLPPPLSFPSSKRAYTHPTSFRVRGTVRTEFLLGVLCCVVALVWAEVELSEMHLETQLCAS
jgi:hypothetical protein